MLTKGFALLAALLIALGGCASTAQNESAGEFVDDTVITTRIKSAFVADKEVSALNIAVETNRGAELSRKKPRFQPGSFSRSAAIRFHTTRDAARGAARERRTSARFPPPRKHRATRGALRL